MNTFLSSRNGKWVLLAVGVLVLAALACGPTPAPTATPTPPPTNTPVPPTPTTPPQPVGGTASVQIVNGSNSVICYVYISPSTDTTWGDDQLGAENVIDIGSSFTITDIPVGTYDFRADDCNSNMLAEEYGIVLTGGTFTWTVGGGSTGSTGSAGGGTGSGGSVTLINNSSQTVCYLYISPSTSSDWGPDQLGSDVIGPGDSYTITDMPFDTYDLRAEDCSGNVLAERYGVQVNGPIEWTLSDQ